MRPDRIIKHFLLYVILISCIIMFIEIALNLSVLEKESQEKLTNELPINTHTTLQLSDLFVPFIKQNRSLPNSTLNNSTLLVMMTSMKNIKKRTLIHKTTLRNWSMLGRNVITILYTSPSDHEWTKEALKLGWKVHEVPFYNNGTPVLRTMIRDAMNRYDSVYYAYANADILFSTGLTDTLNILLDYLPHMNGLLLVGRRTNVHLSLTKIKHPEPGYMTKLARKGRMFTSMAQDYFITTKGGFPWDDIPDFVIGRPGYDNWLLLKALEWRISVVDATDTIVAIHQTGKEGNSAGFKSTNKYINLNIAGNMSWHNAHTTCAPFEMRRDVVGHVVLVKRLLYGKECMVNNSTTIAGVKVDTYAVAPQRKLMKPIVKDMLRKIIAKSKT